MLFWFRSWYQENLEPTWESFSTGLISRFGGKNSSHKAKGDKAYKQIFDEMEKQEEKWKHEDDETCSWSQDSGQPCVFVTTVKSRIVCSNKKDSITSANIIGRRPS